MVLSQSKSPVDESQTTSLRVSTWTRRVSSSAQQRTEALGRIVHLPAQRSCPGIGPLDLWRRLPLAGMERQRQGELEAKL